VAMFFVAMLALLLQLQRDVPDAVLSQFLSHRLFDVVVVAACDDMHGGVIGLSIHAPDVDVVHVDHALDLAKVLLDLLHVNAVGRLFQEKVDHLLQILDGMDQNEDGHANGHQGVDDIKIGKAHHDGTDENDDPAQHVLQHMQVDCLLVQRVALSCHQRRAEIDDNAHHGEHDHAVIVDLGRVNDANRGIVNDHHRAKQKDQRRDHTADDGIPGIAVGVCFVRLPLAFLFEKEGNANAGRISNVVDSVRDDRHASRPQTADKFEDGKSQIEQKRDQNILFGFHFFRSSTGSGSILSNFIHLTALKLPNVSLTISQKEKVLSYFFKMFSKSTI